MSPDREYPDEYHIQDCFTQTGEDQCDTLSEGDVESF
jgi:hypothetical protein